MKKPIAITFILPFLLCSCGSEALSSSSLPSSSSEREVLPYEESTYDEEAIEFMYRLHTFPFGDEGGSFLDGVDPSEIKVVLPDFEMGEQVPTYFGYTYPHYPRMKLIWAFRTEMEMPSSGATLMPAFAGKRLEMVFQSFSCYLQPPDYPGDSTIEAGLSWAPAKLDVVSITDGEHLVVLSERSPSLFLLQEGGENLDDQLFYISTVSSGGIFALLGRPFAARYEFSAPIACYKNWNGNSISIEAFYLFFYAGEGFVLLEDPSFVLSESNPPELSSEVGTYFEVKEDVS